jgi:hypothetical protein
MNHLEPSDHEFVATISLDNFAWRDPLDLDALDFDALADAIRQIADSVEDFGTGGTVRDRNGNTSGMWELRS